MRAQRVRRNAELKEDILASFTEDADEVSFEVFVLLESCFSVAHPWCWLSRKVEGGERLRGSAVKSPKSHIVFHSLNFKSVTV